MGVREESTALLLGANGVLFSCLYQTEKNRTNPANAIKAIELISNVLNP
jgi:hypothetical protein